VVLAHKDAFWCFVEFYAYMYKITTQALIHQELTDQQHHGHGYKPPRFGKKLFPGNYYLKFGCFSGKNHVKFGNFVNFSYIFFGQKYLAP